MFIITAQLASVASEVSNVHFERRLGLLQDILVRWYAVKIKLLSQSQALIQRGMS